jgi:hypothetical protein
VARRVVSAMIMFAALASSAVHAQVNIDQGKAPAQIYDSDCAACHKSIRGLANGRNPSALTSFLSEHYTSSAKEAAQVAAYVLGGGGGIGTPAPAHAPKLKPDTTNASVEEPKDREPKDREVKRPGKPDAAAKPDTAPKPGTAAKPDVAAKPDAEQGTGPKSQRPTPPAKPDGEQQQTAVGEPGKPVPGRREPNTSTATRTHGQAPPPVPAKPTMVVVVPNPPVTPSAPLSPAAAEPAETPQGAEAPVPRDNIPD